MRYKLITIGLMLLIPIYLISCKKENHDEIKKDVAFDVFFMDTLRSDHVNKIKFEYKNKDFDDNPNRYFEVYYTIQDSTFMGDLTDLEKYKFGMLQNAKNIDTLEIDTFNEKGNKYITFFVYDEVKTPVTKDSINLRYDLTKFTVKTFIK